MTGQTHGFRDALIATEGVNHELQQNYAKEMEKMFTQEIKGVRKVGWWANYLATFIFGLALLASALFNHPMTLGDTGRWLWGISGVFCLLISSIGFWIGSKKNMDLRKDSKLMARVGSAGMTIVAFALLFFAFISGDVQNMLYLTPFILLIFVMGLLVSMMDKVQQGELNTRETLLEIKYHLAELSERLSGGKS